MWPTKEIAREYEHKRHLRRTLNASPKKCVICGTLFKSWHKETATCSPRCRAFLIGLPFVRLTKEQYMKVQAKRMLNPKTGPFETNCIAKYYSITDSSGNIYQGVNLSYFVREHNSLFYQEDVILHGYNTLAAHQLRRLRPDRKGAIYQWKGWRWFYCL